MKKILLALFIFPLLYSCSDTENPSEVLVPELKCYTTAMQSKTLIFDEVKATAYNSNYADTVYFEYDSQDRIVKVNGGLIAGSGATIFTPVYALDKNTYDLVLYHNDTIAVEYSANQNFKPYEKKFVIVDGKLIHQKATYFSLTSAPSTQQFTYEYNENQIIEKRNGILYRTFTFENGNLIKSEQISRNSETGQIFMKKIWEFSEYDGTPNLMKGKFFVNGCFFKAFSNNNFKKYEYKVYSYSSGEELLVEYLSIRLDFTNNEGTNSLFVEACE